ncbi:MAG: hypothetical protein WCT18_03000 [Patescibacteria group bacterium]
MMRNRQDRQTYCFNKWDKGDFVYNEPEDALMKLARGAKIGKRLSKCTICPVGNSSCPNMIDISMLGVHPTKKAECTEVQVCSLGISDIDHCPLSK